MSIPSASWAVHIGVIVRRARETSLQDRPAILPESSIRKTVSNWVRKANGSSGVDNCESMDGEGEAARTGGGLMERLARLADGGSFIIGPEAAVGEGVYAGGGSFDGTVKAFIPGRSFRIS